ncbi:hypothetical protein AGLY_008829 [Aphis glycines]|uniref:Uncharacterized protein n=1 Tax=Aphis glycines TaxID=307491 RepID=A0A6G0TJQ2_APHGL|nr:hypothetical protein AGLY_008829 [Aphis glycines]
MCILYSIISSQLINLPKTNVPNTADRRNIKLAKLWIVILYAVVYIGEPSNVPKPSITLMNAYILPMENFWIIEIELMVHWLIPHNQKFSLNKIAIPVAAVARYMSGISSLSLPNTIAIFKVNTTAERIIKHLKYPNLFFTTVSHMFFTRLRLKISLRKRDVYRSPAIVDIALNAKA